MCYNAIDKQDDDGDKDLKFWFFFAEHCHVNYQKHLEDINKKLPVMVALHNFLILHSDLDAISCERSSQFVEDILNPKICVNDGMAVLLRLYFFFRLQQISQTILQAHDVKAVEVFGISDS